MTLPDGLPDGFALGRAADGERVTTDDGRTYVVVENTRGERSLVREDVVTYGDHEHPLLTGAAALFAITGAFLAPLAAVGVVATTGGFESGVATIGAAIGATVAGYLLAVLFLYRTPVGAELWRFLEWYEHIDLLRGRETA